MCIYKKYKILIQVGQSGRDFHRPNNAARSNIIIAANSSVADTPFYLIYDISTLINVISWHLFQ